MLPSVLPSMSKDVVHDVLRPIPPNSLNLNYFLKERKSKYRHVLKF